MVFIDQKSSILIADDNPINLDVMESMLNEFGFEVRVATNGMEVLASTGEEVPDLIVLDINMPEMDGYETCQRLKQSPITAEVPVIFASAINEEFNKLKAFELGAVDYVTKPISMDELKARVTVHVDLAKQRRQLVAQAQELKTFNDMMLDREMRVIDLKREVNELAVQLGKKAPYQNIE